MVPLEVTSPKALCRFRRNGGNIRGVPVFDGDAEIGIAGGCAYHP